MTISRVWWWLIRSSEDATKMSSTIKSAIPLLIALGAAFKLDLSWLPQGWDFVVQAAAQTTAFVTTISTAYFFFRKVKLTLGGQNAVLNDPLWK